MLLRLGVWAVMIITRIIPHAGMGNQMFMYAAGLAAASRLNTELLLDNGDFSTSTTQDRPYQLSCFPAITERTASFYDEWNISPRMAAINLISRRRIRRYHVFRRLMRKLASKLLPAGGMYQPKWCSYSADFESVHDDTLLIGYWESENIFAGIKDLVHRKFMFAPECFNPALTAQVRDCNSVAVHVRRGDKAEGSSAFYSTSEQYLKRAIGKISALTDNPRFFVFSDDIEWCRENLRKAYDADYTFIEGQTPPQDMALMTQCKHVIMGPSTFSWWGAWLNDNPNRIIIAPDVNLWYREGAFCYDPEDRKHLLPSDWIKIS